MKRQVCLGVAAVMAIAASAGSGDVWMQGSEEAWAMLPPLTTTCFPDDGFIEKLDASSTAINAAVEQRKTKNAAVREQFDNMDMAEKARRMQSFMMKNPQAAAKMLGGEQAAGVSGQAAVAEANESSQRLAGELEQLRAAFLAAAEKAVKPIRAKQAELIKAKTVEVGEAAISMFTTAADHAQYVKLIAEENAAYEQACAPYYGANGSFHKWVGSYRTEVINKMVNAGDAGEAAMVVQIQAMELSPEGYRTTAGLEQVSSFIPQLRKIWGFRPNKAQAVVELRKTK